MKKIILGLVAVVVVAVLGLLGAASMQPDRIEVQRKITASASAADVHPYYDDLKKFVEWSPWDERDPNQVVEFSDPSAGVGAWYTWKGNEDVGQGKMSVVSSQPDRVVTSLEFIEPFPSTAQASLILVEQGEQVEITWAFEQEADFGTKLMTLFMDMDSMLGPDFEKGLASLKPLAEAAAAQRKEAEARAAAEAAAEAAALAEAQAQEQQGSAMPGKGTGHAATTRAGAAVGMPR